MICELAEIGRQRRQQHLHVLADLEVAHRAEVDARLAEGPGVHPPVGLEGQVGERIDLGGVEELPSEALELGHQIVVDRLG